MQKGHLWSSSFAPEDRPMKQAAPDGLFNSSVFISWSLSLRGWK